jgi:hypothetical protein
MLTNQQKYNLYSEELWKHYGVEKKLKNFTNKELNDIKAFLNKYPHGRKYGKDKLYWFEAVTFLLKYRENGNTKHAINLIHNRRIARANATADALTQSIVTAMTKNK